MRSDGVHKTSPFYIREKIEVGKISEMLTPQWVKNAMLVIMVIYMYGAMCLKYVSGAESFVEALSFTIFSDQYKWAALWPGFDPYYLGLIIFASLSLAFSFGNIENSKNLQIVTSVIRIVVVILMYIGTIFYLGTSGAHPGQVFDFQK